MNLNEPIKEGKHNEYYIASSFQSTFRLFPAAGRTPDGRVSDVLGACGVLSLPTFRRQTPNSAHILLDYT